MISNYLCPLCEDKNVNKRLVNTSLYWIGQCEICGKIIIASQEHVSNVEDDVFIEMKQECKSLLGNHDYDINLEDSHKEYLGHFHFHLEPIRETVKEPEVSKEPTEEAKKETPAAKAEVKVEETNKSDKPKKVVEKDKK